MNLQHSKSALMVCTALTLIASTSIAQAQSATTDGQVTELEQIVVKGKRAQSASAASDTPLATQTSAEDISKKQINSILDLGRTAEVGVNFNRSTGAVNIRGLEGARVLTTVDGIPINFISDETRSATGGVNTIGFDSLSSVDVLRGADSSRAGNGALGGVLSFKTLEVDDLLTDGRDWGGVGKVEYDSADRSILTSLAVGKRSENTSVLLQAGYKRGNERGNQGRIGGYTGRTVQDPADTKRYDLLFKLRHDLSGGHIVGLTAERFHFDGDVDAMSQQSATGNLRPGNYNTTEQSVRNRVSLDHSFENEVTDGFVDRAKASLYWASQQTAAGLYGYRYSTAIGEYLRDNSNELSAFGVVGQVEKTLAHGDFSHKLMFGYDISRMTTEQYSAGTDGCVTGVETSAATCNNLHTNQADSPKVNGSKLGFFLDDVISYNDTGVRLVPGVRFDWVDYSPQMTEEFKRNPGNPTLASDFTDFDISPKIRLEYDLMQDVNVYAQWSRAFRAPTMGELYSVFGARTTYYRLGNPDLKSETGDAFDLGFDVNTDDFKMKASIFYNRYSNFIETSGALTGQERDDALAEFGLAPFATGDFAQGGVTRKYNIDSAQIWGADFVATKAFDNGLSFTAGFAYANGKNRETGEFLKSVAPMKLALGVNYDADQWGVGANWIGVREAKGRTVNNPRGDSYFKTPGYGIVDLSAWYEPEQFKGMRIQAGIYNVFDKTYYDYSSARSKGTPYERHTEPGRTFKISLTQKF